MSAKHAGLAYRPDIDGLRAIAVIAVLLHHVWPKFLSGGFIGVDVFFVISGYLITKIVSAEIKDGSFTFASFYTRRARRLLPALMVVLIVVLVAGWFFLLPSDYLATLRASFATTVFSSNILFWRDLSKGYFAADAKLNPLLHTWSLGVEEQFYLVFPVFLLLCARVFPRWIKHFVVAGIVLSFGISIMLIAAKSVAVFFLAPFRAWELLVGSAIALGLVPTLGNEIARQWAVALGLLTICAAAAIYTPGTTFPGWAALLPVLGAVAIIHAGGSGLKSGPQSLLSTTPFVHVGRISYSLYLWHWPVIVLAKYVLQIKVGLAVGSILILVSYALAALSYRFVESPFRATRSASNGGFLSLGLAGSLILACISLVGVALHGFESRVDAKALAFDRARSSKIPFKACDLKTEWCIVGNKFAKPSAIFWGDSHMLAWAPAIEKVLLASGRSGYLVVHSACPPGWGIEAVGIETCSRSNLRLKKFLSTQSGIRLIVLAANWQTYFQPGRIRAEHGDGKSSDPGLLLESRMRDTIESLTRSGLEVSILGQVPAYDVNVPFELARNLGKLSGAKRIAPAEDRFGPVLATIANEFDASYVDVTASICTPICEIQRDGRSLYRDDGHLSSIGALAYVSVIEKAINGNHDSMTVQKRRKH